MHTPETTEDAFGFGSLRGSTKDRIKQIKPSSPPEPPPNLARVDAVADSAGFVSREAPEQGSSSFRGSRSQGPEPTIALNMRAPVSIGQAFQQFCKENRYSYPEGLAEIMHRAGLRTR